MSALHCSSCRESWTLAEPPPENPFCPKCRVPLVRAMPTRSDQTVSGTSFPSSATLITVEQARLDPRRRFGHFVLLGELGKGGMGVVYRAWDDRLRRTVALKLLLTADADPGTKARFQREAHAVARLRHAAIVAIHDVGEIQGRPYIAMDCIEGHSLDRKLDGPSALSFEEGIEVVSRVARAVHYAHEQGVIHRDLKPSNVMVDANDQPYVLDFGLAKIQDSRSLATKEGSLIGTPNYMPPEQVGPKGGEVDARSDVYALGATLFHVLTGKPPFEGPSEINVVTQLLMREAPAPSATNRRAVGDLDTICAKCLEKEPERRYASAAELADELDRYLAGDPLLARPLGFFARTARSLARNKKSVAAALATATFMIVALAYPLLRPGLEARRHARAAADARKAVMDEVGRDRKRSVAALEKASAVPDAGGAVAPLVSELAAVARELGEVSEASLTTLGRSAGGSDTPEADLESAVSAALTELAPKKLLSWAAHERGRAFSTLGQLVDATRERALAYRLDSSGEHGATAFLEIAEDLAAKEDWTRALALFRTIAARPLVPSLRARADVDAGRALLALGSIEEGRRVLLRGLGRKALGEHATREARWLETIASHLVGRAVFPIAASGVLVHRFAPGNGPSDVVVLAGDRLAVHRLDAAAKLTPVASIETGAGARTLTLVKTREGERLALAFESSGCGFELYRFQDDRLERTQRTLIPGPFHDPAILAAGDDGSGEDALAFQVRVEHNLAVPLLLTHLSATLGVFPLMDARNYGYMAAFADLDGCGKCELVLASSEWKGFAVAVWKQGKFVFSRPLGSPRGLTVGRSGGRDHVLVAMDRSRGEDAIFADDPGLHPERPDAVWRLSWPSGEAVLEKLVERPFEERDRWSFALPARALGAFPEDPAAAIAREHGGRQPRLVVLAPGLSPVRVGFPDSGPQDQGDLRGDGSVQLVFGGPELLVTGLGDSASAVPAPDASDGAHDTSPLDVGLDLLDCGEAREASLELQSFLARPGTPRADRSRASLALARALDVLGEHGSARDTCLALAGSDPRASKEAILLAAAQAEALGDWSGAATDLTRLRSLEALTPDETSEIDRRLRRIRPLTTFTPVVSLDGRDPSPLLEVTEALLVARSERGIRLRSRPRGEGEGLASLSLPLTHDGSSFALRARVFVERLDFGTSLRIAFAGPGGEPAIEIVCRGGGSVDTWSRHVALGGAIPLSVGDFDRKQPVVLEIIYVEADAALRCSVEHAGVRRTAIVQLGHALAPGLGHLVVTANTYPGQGGFALFDVASLELSGPPGALAIAGEGAAPSEETSLARASAVFSLGDKARALEQLSALGGAKSAGVATTARFLAALAASDLGRADEAQERLAGLEARGPGGMIWERDVCGLTEGERAALAVAYARREGSHGLVERASGLLESGRPGEALIALLGSGKAAHPIEVAAALDACGDAEGALAALAPLDDPRVDALRGRFAFELGRYEDACRFWEKNPPRDAESQASVARARRLAGAHGLEVR